MKVSITSKRGMRSANIEKEHRTQYAFLRPGKTSHSLFLNEQMSVAVSSIGHHRRPEHLSSISYPDITDSTLIMATATRLVAATTSVRRLKLNTHFHHNGGGGRDHPCTPSPTLGNPTLQNHFSPREVRRSDTISLSQLGVRRQRFSR